MASKRKTLDGLLLDNVVDVLTKLPGFNVRDGKRHKYVASFPGVGRMPLDQSTDVKRMVVGNISRAYEIPKNVLYDTMRRGKWSEKNYSTYLNTLSQYKK